MQIIQSPPHPSCPPSSPETPGRVRTSRSNALRIIERALRVGDVVDLGPWQLRWCQRGDTFFEGDDELHAREPGIYQRAAVFRTREAYTQQRPDGYTWLHAGHLDWLPQLVGPLLDQLSTEAHEAFLMTLVFRHVMRSSRPRPRSIGSHPLRRSAS